MFCTMCGKELKEGENNFCPHCGESLHNSAAQSFDRRARRFCAEDAPDGGWTVLGFFFPLVGFILYLVWKDTLPLRSKSCGKGALFGAIAEACVAVLSVAICAAFLFVFLANGTYA